MSKKAYSSPELTVHGNLESLTLAGSQPFADVPQGDNNTAFVPGS